MIGIVVVSYQSDDRTVAFISEELSKVEIPHSIVVVDNGATEEEAAALEARLPFIKVIAAENGGYARGNNIGANWLRDNIHPTHILFANNDIRLSSNHVVETLVTKAMANPKIGVIGPEVVGLDGNRQSPEPYMGLWKRYVWMYLSTPFLSKARKRTVFGLDYPEKAEEGFHYKLSGSFFLADAEAFFRAGMFDENTFLYAEENILSERLFKIGKGCYFCPSVRVLHEHGKTVSKYYSGHLSALLQYRSMAYYYRQYRGSSRLSIVLAGMFFRIFLALK